jgi:EpsD family peptidyl-prolyl cis-trans isomerase
MKTRSPNGRRAPRTGPSPMLTLPALLTLLLTLLLTGCSPAGLDESQVLARVNQDEISVHQFNFALGKQAPKVLGQADRIALLEKLIDRQLAVQQAQILELERHPEVMMRLEEARRDILAAVYAEHLAVGVRAPDNETAARYYADHPGLFAERRIYRLREITLAADAPALAETRARLARRDEPAGLLAWLEEQPGGFSDQRVIRAAERLPVEIADRLVTVEPGDIIAFERADGLAIYQLESAEKAPVSWQEAAPIIRAHLQKQNQKAALGNELQRLRAQGTIQRNLAPLRP